MAAQIEMTEQIGRTAQASIPEATNRVGVIPTEVVQARTLAVVIQGQVTSEVLIDLCSTPEKRALTRAGEIATVAAVTRWEGFKTQKIYTITIFFHPAVDLR